MRLINTTTLDLREFNQADVPKYAILSHCWGELSDEVSFKEYSKGLKHQTTGYSKIQQFCKIALENRLEWGWVDTCCIDKRSSAELSESINSMYQWYKDAQVCYVLLNDVDALRDWRNSRWWGRGWTLQELIAPVVVEFLDCNWHNFGSRTSLALEIRKITKIPLPVLNGYAPPWDWTIAQRMSWAAGRRTTRVEDTAYSLLGLFRLNMPLLYGEGIKAFVRLQLELLQTFEDDSVLAWQSVNKSQCSILAESPDDFESCSMMEPVDSHWIRAPLRSLKPPRVTSWGIEISVNAPKLSPRRPLERGRYGRWLAIPLTIMRDGRILELPCTLIVTSMDPGSARWWRDECINVGASKAFVKLRESYNLDSPSKEKLVYLQFNRTFSG